MAKKTTMVLNLNILITLLAIGMPLLLIFFFLPAIFELKRPQDCGPRLMPDSVPQVRLLARMISQLRNIEEDQESAESDVRLVTIKSFLPNLEA